VWNECIVRLTESLLVVCCHNNLAFNYSLYSYHFDSCVEVLTQKGKTYNFGEILGRLANSRAYLVIIVM